MAILLKPVTIEKGAENELALEKTEILTIPKVAADPFFSDSANWKAITLNYLSTVGNQSEVVVFNDLAPVNPTAPFKVSARARDAFFLNSMVIYDYDGGSLKISRAELLVIEPDLDMTFVAALPDVVLNFTDFIFNAADQIQGQNTEQNQLYIHDSLKLNGVDNTVITNIQGPAITVSPEHSQPYTEEGVLQVTRKAVAELVFEETFESGLLGVFSPVAGSEGQVGVNNSGGFAMYINVLNKAITTFTTVIGKKYMVTCDDTSVGKGGNATLNVIAGATDAGTVIAAQIGRINLNTSGKGIIFTATSTTTSLTYRVNGGTSFRVNNIKVERLAD